MLDILRKRKSVRIFDGRAVENSKIEKLLEAALLSPSSRNHDPWEFIAITDSGRIKSLSESKKSGSSFLKQAPLVIAVIADKNKSDVWVEDCSIASIIIQLEAETLDLGSCWVQIRKRETEEGVLSEDFVRNVLAIPENYAVLSLIGLGYPEKREERIPKSTEADKLHFNSF